MNNSNITMEQVVQRAEHFCVMFRKGQFAVPEPITDEMRFKAWKELRDEMEFEQWQESLTQCQCPRGWQAWTFAANGETCWVHSYDCPKSSKQSGKESLK